MTFHTSYSEFPLDVADAARIWDFDLWPFPSEFDVAEVRKLPLSLEQSRT